MEVGWKGVARMGYRYRVALEILLAIGAGWSTAFAENSRSSGVKGELVAIGSLPGAAIDRTDFTGKYEEGTPANQIGGFSAIDYSGQANRYWVLSDRGPADGAASYRCRLHQIALKVDLNAKRIDVTVEGTVSLVSEAGEPLLGALSALPDDRKRRGIAFDPEGLRWLPDGSWVISDEYGPAVDRFSADGQRLSSYPLPNWMRLTDELDLAKAERGAMPNRGLEGLALSVDQRFLVAAMQGPLIQDSGYRDGKRYGEWVRLLQIPIDGGGAQKQWLYPLSETSNGISEILAFDDHRYLVLERDGRTRSEAQSKEVVLIDVGQASDVSSIDQLFPGALDERLHPVTKQRVIDLLEPSLALPATHTLEKPEGLAWGPPLPDGRRLLMVCFDNDFDPMQDSLFLAFAFDSVMGRE